VRDQSLPAIDRYDDSTESTLKNFARPKKLHPNLKKSIVYLKETFKPSSTVKKSGFWGG
jgi:hypothetical protein